MKETRLMMGMPIGVEIVGRTDAAERIEEAFSLFRSIDERFSTYKKDSEISRINRGELPAAQWSQEMQEVFTRAEETRRATGGFFSIETPEGAYDPSGLVKGWAIERAAGLLKDRGVEGFLIDAGGDIATYGMNAQGAPWSVGVRNPLNRSEIVKVVYPRGRGIATSGTYIRGRHIWNPHTGAAVETPFVSLTVIGENVYEADRFATAAFAMGERGIHFLEQREDLEAYAIESGGRATMTSGFESYCAQHRLRTTEV